MENTIHQIIRDAEASYINGSVQLGSYVTWEMHKTVETISAYLNSKHTSGDKDSLGRDKPFFNIVSAAANIWYRATDLDRKDINLLPAKSKDILISFIANVYLKDWMKKNNFGQFLNQWGRTLAQYGSAVTKFVSKRGKLTPSVIPWNRLIVDAVDFDALPRIEVLFKTPAQLRKNKDYDQEIVESLIDGQSSRKNIDGSSQDTKDVFIQLYEVHGELPLSLLTDNEEDEKPRQQMHVVSYVGKGSDKFDDFTLYRGKEAEDPYILTHLIEEDGRTLAIGSVEYLFNAQWMQNHTIKNLKDTLDLASKLIFQTSDSKFVGRNVLTAIETGDIMIHDLNQPLTQINNSKADVTALMNFAEKWKQLEQEITATPEASRGITPVSGTPLGTTQILIGQANSLFEIMVENKGLHLVDMLEKKIIPHIKSKMKNDTAEITAVLEDHDIQKIDAIYIPNEAIRRYNRRTSNQVLEQAEKAVTTSIEPFDAATEEKAVKQSLAPLGSQRFFSPGNISWDKVFKDLEWKLDINITNELIDKQAVFTGLNNALQTIASFAGRPMTPDERLIFNKIMSITGQVSPIELSTANVAELGARAPVGQQLQTIEK